jgi:transcriptional regulator with XRE-family HTH domain
MLREWQQRRRLSQRALAVEAMVLPGRISFLESGRAMPGRKMILRIYNTLDVPLTGKECDVCEQADLRPCLPHSCSIVRSYLPTPLPLGPPFALERPQNPLLSASATSCARE